MRPCSGKKKWADVETLENRFSSLYQVSWLKEATVQEMRRWLDGIWQWNLVWRRNLFEWESELSHTLISALSSCEVKQNLEDGWVWGGDNSGFYSVNSTYKHSFQMLVSSISVSSSLFGTKSPL